MELDPHIIQAGGDVFIGEQGLDISGTGVKSGSKISYYTGSQTVGVSTPAANCVVGDTRNYFISPTEFVGRTGNWFIENTSKVAFVVNDPAISIKILDQNTGKDVTGKSVPAGSFINFRVESNLYVISRRSDARLNDRPKGFVTIKVKSADGTIYSHLNEDSVNAISLTGQFLNALPFYLVPVNVPKKGWATEALDTKGNRIYKAGSYTVWIECNVNKMRDNYKDSSGSSYTGKTISSTRMITIASDTVRIESSKSSIIRGGRFAVTITGMPNTSYLLWVEGISLIPDDIGQPPTIIDDQENVRRDPVSGPFTIGSYAFMGGGGRMVQQDVAQYSGGVNVNGTVYYAQITLSNSGTRTVGFQTTRNTKDQMYTIRVERRDAAGRFKSDDVDVNVHKGAVTIVAVGNGSYDFGEKVRLAGTNSETSDVYLFISGPNLPPEGGSLTDPNTTVIDGLSNSFTSVDVLEDNTWQYKWLTAYLNIEAGTYTIYAAATPNHKDNLENTLFGTVSVILGKPTEIENANISFENHPGKKYHVGLSFAGEERDYVKIVFETLVKNGVSVFYDDNEEVEMWGKNLAVYLPEVFSKDVGCVVIFASKNYIKKAYPSLEKDAALTTAIYSKKEYILVGKFDDIQIPGILSTIKNINLENMPGEKFASLIILKLQRLKII